MSVFNIMLGFFSVQSEFVLILLLLALACPVLEGFDYFFQGKDALDSIMLEIC